MLCDMDQELKWRRWWKPRKDVPALCWGFMPTPSASIVSNKCYSKSAFNNTITEIWKNRINHLPLWYFVFNIQICHHFLFYFWRKINHHLLIHTQNSVIMKCSRLNSQHTVSPIDSVTILNPLFWLWNLRGKEFPHVKGREVPQGTAPAGAYSSPYLRGKEFPHVKGRKVAQGTAPAGAYSGPYLPMDNYLQELYLPHCLILPAKSALIVTKPNNSPTPLWCFSS